MKEILKICGLLAAFYFFAVATSYRKYGEIPCTSQIQAFLMKDTINRGGWYTINKDTIVIQAYKDTLWDTKTATMCQILKDSCNISNFSILVVDTVLARDPARQTRYGNRIFYRKCN